MENNNEKHVHGEGNVCHDCMHGGMFGHGHRHLMRWMIRVAVMVVVFLIAFHMGEMKGMLESRGYYGHGIYRTNMMYGNDVGGEYGPGMMGQGWTTVTPDSVTVTPAVPAKPATPAK